MNRRRFLQFAGITATGVAFAPAHILVPIAAPLPETIGLSIRMVRQYSPSDNKMMNKFDMLWGMPTEQARISA